SRAPQVARRWLDEEVGNAVAGLVPVAAGEGRRAEAALEYLREAKRRGHAAVIGAQVKRAPAGAAEVVRRLVLEREEKVYPPFDDGTAPGWLKAATATPAAARAEKLPGWL